MRYSGKDSVCGPKIGVDRIDKDEYTLGVRSKFRGMGAAGRGRRWRE